MAPACNLTRSRAFTAPAPTLFPDNGHYYEVISVAATFPDALQKFRSSFEVSSKFYYPHLLTMDSPAEGYFIHVTLGIQETWLAASDANIEGEWRWVDGPEAGLAVSLSLFWFAGEPTNSSAEDYAASTGIGWFDVPASSTRTYVLEYELQHPSGCKS